MNRLNISQIIRHFSRKRNYVLINILGLGIGLGCVILISTFILHEFSFDNYHKNSSRIYRVIEGDNCNTVYAMGEAFTNNIPEIESVARIYKNHDAQVKKDETYFKESEFYFADKTLLDLLDIELLVGDKKSQLEEHNSLLISKKMANKYFANQNPIGEYLNVLISGNELQLKISGVFKDFPSYSSIQADFLTEMETSFPLFLDVSYSIGFSEEKENIDFKSEWKKNNFQTLLLLQPEVNTDQVEKKCSEICLELRGEEMFKEISLQPYNEIYLHSAELSSGEFFQQNHVASLKIFLAIGFLILLIALINYILISNADNNSSIKEIACRKVLGASKIYILSSLIIKSCLLTFLSLIPAMLFVKFTIPLFNNYFQQNINLDLFLKWPYTLLLLSIVIFTGVIAGLYLGIKAWKINPALGFKSQISTKNKFFNLDSSLIIVQFSIFILLAISSITIFNQYRYSLNKDLGFTTENIIALDLMDNELGSKSELIRNFASSLPNVEECISMSFMIPPTDNTLLVSYRDDKTNTKQSNLILLFSAGATELMDIDIIDGVSFTESSAQNRSNILINESAAKKYEVGIGDKIAAFNVIGITKDFHFQSLHKKIVPILIFPQIKNLPYLLIKTNGANDKVISQLKEYYADMSLAHKFECETLNERIENFYEKEKKEMKVLVFFFIVSAVLSIMGLLGFVSLKLISRTKEIGVRKVNGAKEKEILFMLNADFIKQVILAFIISCPIAYFAMIKWLENFAYKTAINWWFFVLAGITALIIAIVSVSWQSLRTASKNPVEALRYE